MSSQKQGLRNNASSPGSIANSQHHDLSASQRSANGIPGTIKQILAASNVKTPLSDYAMLWVVNNDTSPHYLAISKDSDIPAGAVTAATGMCIPAGQGVLICCGASNDDQQSMACKSDSIQIHITVLEV